MKLSTSLLVLTIIAISSMLHHSFKCFFICCRIYAFSSISLFVIINSGFVSYFLFA